MKNDKNNVTEIPDDLLAYAKQAVKDLPVTVSDAVSMFLEIQWLEKTCDNCINDRADENDEYGEGICILIKGANYCGHWDSKRYPITNFPWKQLYRKLKKR